MTTLQAPRAVPTPPGRGGPRPASAPGRSVRTPVVPRVAAMTVMAVFTVYFLLPIWWLLVASSKTRGDIIGTNPLWFADLHLVENLRDVVTYRDGLFVQWMGNSLLYAGVGALVATVLAAMCGYALAKYRFRGREAIFNVVLGGVLVPATALALPLFLLFSSVRLTDTYWAVLLPSIVSPFGVYLARIYAAASVPDELIEAARLDGAGEIRTFFGVSVRLMVPALVTIFLFQFVTIWNNFFLPLIMLRDERKFPVTFGLYTWNSQLNQIPELNTFVLVGSLLSILPLVVAFLALQRFWRGGLGTGSVK